MQTLNSNSYKADIISANIEADREAIEMQIDYWGHGSREKKLARMTMQVNHSSLSRRPRFVTKLGMDFTTSAATALKRIIFKKQAKRRNKIVACYTTLMLRLRNAFKVNVFQFIAMCFPRDSLMCAGLWYNHECEQC